MAMNDEMLKDILKGLDKCILENKCFHSQMADVYDWINMKGFKRLCEMKAYKFMTKMRLLHRFSINNLNIIIPKSDIENINVIPYNFYNMDRMLVDENTIKTTVRTGMENWLKMEIENLNYYTECWYKLMDMKNPKGVILGCFVKEMLDATQCKIKSLQRHIMNYKAENYDIELLKRIQCDLHDKIRDEKMKKVAVI